MKRVVGTCSICKGPVTIPDPWYSVDPPVPECSRCGAEAASFGPEIPMRPRRSFRVDYGSPQMRTADLNGWDSVRQERGVDFDPTAAPRWS